MATVTASIVLQHSFLSPHSVATTLGPFIGYYQHGKSPEMLAVKSLNVLEREMVDQVRYTVDLVSIL